LLDFSGAVIKEDWLFPRSQDSSGPASFWGGNISLYMGVLLLSSFDQTFNRPKKYNRANKKKYISKNDW